MRKQLVIWIFVFLALIQIAFAQPPFIEQTVANEGLQIEVPIFEIVPVSSNFTFYFHVFNLSNGVPINNSDCLIHIYSYEDGSHILEQDAVLYGNQIDFEVEINDSVLTESGVYFKLIQCEVDGLGGFFGNQFRVGSNSVEASTSDAIINSILLLIFVILFVVCLAFAYNTDGENKFTMGDSGEPLIEINTGKYVKLLLYLFSYLFFWMLTWVAWQIGDMFLMSQTLTGVLRVLFIFETIVWVPLFIIVVVIGLIKHLADIQLEKQTRRGLFPRNKK